MCGRLNVTDDAAVIDLLGWLGVSLSGEPLQQRRCIRAAEQISIIRHVNSAAVLCSATWWLLLEPTVEGFKPSKFTSFNTRQDKLRVPGSAGFVAYQSQRCIVPVRGFGETEQSATKPRYTDFFGAEALALAGLYRRWVHPVTGEERLSCSVITQAPHPRLMPYHSKSMPLLLPRQACHRWLDSRTPLADLEPLSKSALPVGLWAQAIDKPTTYQPLGQPQWLAADPSW